MSGIWGNRIKYSIFGESHGKAIGIIIDGLKPGIKLDLDFIKGEMDRRAPGRSSLTTGRKEEDNFQILSGLFNGYTTGTPLCVMIENMDQRSKDYGKIKDVLRPGHADYTGHVKYKGFNDYRGGGHFSGRITAPLVFAGAVAKQILSENNIVIGSHIKSIGDLEDDYMDYVNIDEKTINEFRNKEFPLLNPQLESEMKELILQIKSGGDSIGGIIEGAVVNLPAGIGEPFFYSVESVLSQLFFSIPAVKGVEFGAGFELSKMRGSKGNDEFCIIDEKVKTKSNNNGGVLGGISTGMPLIFRTAIKPTPSIALSQNTVDISKMEECRFEVLGRHDPCIVIRAIPVVEAAAAMGILELLDGVTNPQ